MIELPVSNQPEQLFNVVVNGVNYDFRILISGRLGIWAMSISSAGIPIVEGVNLLSGVELFNKYNIGIKNLYVINIDNSVLDPSANDLGTGSRIFLLTDEEAENANAI